MAKESAAYTLLTFFPGGEVGGWFDTREEGQADCPPGQLSGTSCIVGGEGWMLGEPAQRVPYT